MNSLLQQQLKIAFGDDFHEKIEDEAFQNFLKLVTATYNSYDEEEKFLEHVLEVSARELEETNSHLLKQQELLKSVENSMDDGVFYKDLDYKYIGCNKKFAEFLGYKEEDIIGKSDYDFFDDETALRYQKSNDELLLEGKKVTYKNWLQYKGKKSYILISKTPLVDIQGKVVGIVGVTRDITYEYELQQDIERKNIMLIEQNKLVSMGAMIANIAHQWRQPLNTLGIIVQKIDILYKLNMLNEKTVEENVSEAMLIMQEMSETIDDFRDFFNPARVLEEFNLYEAILKSYAIIKSRITLNNIDFKIEIYDQYFVQGYKNEFFQVILNLLNNAIEALVEKKIVEPRIKLTAKKGSGNIIIEVSDNAKGIPDEILNKIFDPYFTTKDKGTGLGLYMAKMIIEDHMQGKMSVQKDLSGTTFIIILKESTNKSD